MFIVNLVIVSENCRLMREPWPSGAETGSNPRKIATFSLDFVILKAEYFRQGRTRRPSVLNPNGRRN